MKKRLLLLTIVIMLTITGCQNTTSAPSTASVTVPSATASEAMPTPTPVPSASPVPSDAPASEPSTLPTQQTLFNKAVEKELMKSKEITLGQGADAPGGLNDFIASNPDFLYNQANRVLTSSGAEVTDGGERARLLLDSGIAPANDLLNRERLSKFVDNYKAKIPDSIAIASSGSPIALWITVYSYDGKGSAYTVESFAAGSSNLYKSYTVEKLEETDKEWIMINEPMSKMRYPKYGYQPIAPGKIDGEATEQQAVDYIEAIRQTSEYHPYTAKTVARGEQENINGSTCYIIYMLDANDVETGYSFAVAKDFSRFYEMDPGHGNWQLYAEPKPAP